MSWWIIDLKNYIFKIFLIILFINQIGHLAHVQLKLRNLSLEREGTWKMTGLSKLKRFDTHLIGVAATIWNWEKRAFYRHFYRHFCQDNISWQYENALKCRQFKYNNFSVIFGGNFLYDTHTTQISNRKKNLSNSALIISFSWITCTAVFVKFKTSTILEKLV